MRSEVDVLREIANALLQAVEMREEGKGSLHPNKVLEAWTLARKWREGVTSSSAVEPEQEP